MDAYVRERNIGKQCSVDGCERSAHSRGWCNPHWQRFNKGLSSTSPIAQRFKSFGDRLKAYTSRDVTTGCLLWTAAITGNGYGSVAAGEGGRQAHRVAYEWHTGERLAPTDIVHHKCANRLCVEPTHLQRVQPHENTAEMFERKAYQARIAELEAQLAALQ
ncbi:HNH endonuclease [Mycobacteroides franklinii]|uniref:HNH endonuclease n=1 Tax=Mycobacteroides franklinii TaxID=948102 RepID=UPI0013E8F4A1